MTPMGAAEREARTCVGARLRERRGEIEEAILTRVYGISDPTHHTPDPNYADGLRAAVSAALDYGLESIERGEEDDLSVPPALLDQARLAERNGVSLETVLRRYVAGHTILCDFLFDGEAGGARCEDAELQRILRHQACLFDQLLAAVSREHTSEAHSRSGSVERRRLECVERLLAGELVDHQMFGYDFDDFHAGLVVTGYNARDAVCNVASRLDLDHLSVCPDPRTTWAWFGSRTCPDLDDLEAVLGEELRGEGTAAVGTPEKGIAGWRLSHQQASAALPIAMRTPGRIVRYVDVALVASMLQNDVLATFMQDSYLGPLEAAPDGGAVLLDTLRAYLTSGRNVSSAAASLRVSRNTVSSRLRSIEETLGKPIGSLAADLELALRLWQVDATADAV
jgi:PucR C-terminal helix-turn-helix domain/GGDEF-like domain